MILLHVYEMFVKQTNYFSLHFIFWASYFYNTDLIYIHVFVLLNWFYIYKKRFSNVLRIIVVTDS